MPGAWEIDNRPKLLIGLPHKDQVTMEWALAFRNLQVNVPAIFTCSRGTPIDMARNEIIKSAQNSGVEWVFFLDTDVTCPPDTIIRLMAHGLPIVSGVYWTRAPPLEPTVWREVPGGKQAIPFQPGSGLIEADFIGAGMLLVHMSVFEHLPWPPFEWTLSFQDPKDFSKGTSEDFHFCKLARQRGYHIMVDTSLIGRHGISNSYSSWDGIKISEI